MLIRFAVTNYRSISDRQEISLVASSLRDSANSVLRTPQAGHLSLLPTAIVYGPNASGKSNLFNAIKFMKNAALHSHSQGDKDTKIPLVPFRLAPHTQKMPSMFEIDFYADDIRYSYGFSVINGKFDEEWLFSFPLGYQRILFERKGNSFSFGRLFKGQNRTISELTRENSLFLSAAHQNNHDSLKPVLDFFRNIKLYGNISGTGHGVNSLYEEKDVDSRVVLFIEEMRSGINGFRKIERNFTEEEFKLRAGLNDLLKKSSGIESDFFEDTPDSKQKIIEFGHQSSGGETVYFDLEDESAGTLRLLVMLNRVFEALDTGSLVVVDELDASLHSQISEAIVSMFSDQRINRNGAQLIATTHDTNLLQSNVLRRDQFWLVEKSDFGASEIYPLIDYRTKATDNLERGYLQGRYRAVPRVRDLITLLAEETANRGAKSGQKLQTNIETTDAGSDIPSGS
jgi:AAA15 family ATPase/GTPase